MECMPLGAGRGLLCALLISVSAAAHETDQFTVPAGKRFADLGDFFNAWLYDTLERSVNKTNDKIRHALEAERDRSYLEYLQSPMTLSTTVWQEFTSAYFLIEGFEGLVHSGNFTKQYPGRVVGYRETIQNIYQHVHFPLDPRQFFRLWHASTMQVYGVYFGPDKIGHFADMGYRYYQAYDRAKRNGLSEEEAYRETVEVGTKGLFFAEAGMVGYGSAGAYSNADLVSNYIGFKFYLNLTRAERVKGEMHPPFVRIEGEYWRINPHVRRELPFFERFVSNHLNEALNPSLFEEGMRDTVREAVTKRADKILHFYADANGNRRPREYFDAIWEEVTTYYGEDYGYRGTYDELITIGNTCFPKPPSSDEPNPSANGYTRLHWAAQAGDTAAAVRLLGDGAAVVDERVCSLERESDEWGNTPLHVAAAAGHARVVELLLDRGADINGRNENGATPLHRALDHPQVVRLLIARGADPDARDERGRTPLHWLARYPTPPSARALLEAGADAEATDHEGRTPLHRAALWGQTEMMAALLAAGASIDARARFDTTPLHFAVRRPDAEAVSLLLHYGADIDAADEFGLAALHDAARRGNPTLVRVLMEAGADPNVGDAYGSTPLHLAVREDKELATRLLVDGGADVNAANRAGTVPLHEAVFAGRNSLVRLLLARGANVTAENARGQSAMDLASASGNSVAFLLMDSSRARVARDRAMGMR